MLRRARQCPNATRTRAAVNPNSAARANKASSAAAAASRNKPAACPASRARWTATTIATADTPMQGPLSRGPCFVADQREEIAMSKQNRNPGSQRQQPQQGTGAGSRQMEQQTAGGS